MKIFLKCNEAAHLCDKIQYKEVSFWDRISLKVHLILCTICRTYTKKNTKLTDTINSANLKTLCSEEKQQLKSKLEHEIKNARES